MTTPQDEANGFLEQILRGDVPQELRIQFDVLSPVGLASLWTVVTLAFVETILDVRSAHEQSLPMASDNRPLLGRLARHLEGYMSEAHSRNPELSDQERQAQRDLLLSMLDATRKALDQVSDS